MGLNHVFESFPFGPNARFTPIYESADSAIEHPLVDCVATLAYRHAQVSFSFGAVIHIPDKCFYLIKRKVIARRQIR